MQSLFSRSTYGGEILSKYRKLLISCSSELVASLSTGFLFTDFGSDELFESLSVCAK
ncbi:unnamed protein product [Schistosoma margrebowiei]|uniref:Uncharacterized protein n=1 Tax=Schistosoma margrebowiei TaxID=48269 RepID=A0A3P8CDN1_9TREM|nr:unnamed protein product [Schistosoma margrebowiei]